MSLAEITAGPPGRTGADPRRTIALHANEIIAAANGGQLSSFRNKLINGALRLWQRGTSGAFGVYGADRWLCSSGAGTWSRSTDSPDSALFPYSIEWALGVSGSFPALGQRIEAANCADMVGKKMRLTFWAKSIAGAANLYAVLQYANSTDSFGAITTIESVLAAAAPSGSWTFYEITFAALPANAANGVQVQIFRTNSTASTTRATGIQLEVVDTTDPKSTAFERRPLAVELALAQRYYEKSFAPDTTPAQNIGVDTGEATWAAQTAGSSTGQRSQRITFRTRKRTAPTMTLYNPAAANAQARDETLSGDCSSSAAQRIGEDGFCLFATGNASTAVGNNIGAHWAAAAEL